MDGLLLVDSTMSSTSTPVERLFSVVGQVVTTTRNRLHPKTVKLLVFLQEDLPLHRDINFQRFLNIRPMDRDVEFVGDKRFFRVFGLL